jgi:Raf kinase inhibitor-like YbhB/YbcL family protein
MVVEGITIMKRLMIVLFVWGLILTSCSQAQGNETLVSDGQPTILVTSPAFAPGEIIPVQFTCDGQNVSPELSWGDIPADAQSLALIMDDPDAPVGTWVHWVVYNLDPKLTDLEEGSQNVGIDGENSSRKPGYAGPCPPKGSSHRYFFKLYALDTRLALDSGASKGDLEQAMHGHILGFGQLMGTFER